MAQVMDADVLQPALLLDLRPEPAHLLHRLVGRVAGKEPRRSLRHQEQALTHDGGCLVRDRHAVGAALFGHCGRLGPAHVFEVELLEPRLPHLAQPGAGQHAHADDVVGASVLGRIQRGGELGDFLLGQEPLARGLGAAMEALGGVVLAPSPLDRQREHLAQHLPDPVCADGCWFGPLQLARSVVGLFLVGPRPALGDLRQQLVDVGGRDLRHQLSTPDRFHHLGQRRPLIGRAAG